MVWFGALVAVTLQTAYLSPPVAMSAYYLKQVVKDWSLGTIYKGMFQFMVLQCIAIAVVMFVPADRHLRSPSSCSTRRAQVQTEEVDDSMNRLEEDPRQGGDDGSRPRSRRRSKVAVRSEGRASRPAFFCYNRTWSSTSTRRSTAPAPGARAGSATPAATSSRCGSPTRISARRRRCWRRSRNGSGTACSATPSPPEELREAIVERLERLYRWRVDPAWIVFLPGLVAGLHHAARVLVAPGEQVLVPRPVYHHLKRAARACAAALR